MSSDRSLQRVGDIYYGYNRWNEREALFFHRKVSLRYTIFLLHVEKNSAGYNQKVSGIIARCIWAMRNKMNKEMPYY